MTAPPELPAPLVPAEVDLRDFAFVPLDVVRLRDSDLAAISTGEEFKAAVLLWCASWHQVPAGSLTDDDRVLSRFAQATNWQRVKSGALRGFVRCSDGRLYHPVIAEKAVEAWNAKLRQRERTRAATLAREAKRRPIDVQRDDGRDEPRDVNRDDVRQMRTDVDQGTGTGTGTGTETEIETGNGPVVGAALAPAPSAAKASPTRGTRLPEGWQLPKVWGVWAQETYPHWTADTVRLIAEKFGNHWRATPGKSGTKLDWLATWQNWCHSGITQKEHPPPKAPPSMNGAAAGPEWMQERDAARRAFYGRAAAQTEPAWRREQRERTAAFAGAAAAQRSTEIIDLVATEIPTSDEPDD